jgi:hypothetical protein
MGKTEYLKALTSVVTWPHEPFPDRFDRVAELREQITRLSAAKYIISGMMLPTLARALIYLTHERRGSVATVSF